MAKCKTSDAALKKSKRKLSGLVENYMSYLDEARTPSMAVRAAAQMLDQKAFVKYDASKKDSDEYLSELRRAKSIYFIDRNKVNIAAVRLGGLIKDGINIAGAHVDFCTLTNKVNSMVKKSDGLYLDTRPYGGFYAHQWMDRPLLVIGETLVKTGKGRRELVEWEMSGHIPEATIHNPKGYRETVPAAKAYGDVFKLEDLDVFTGYKDEKAFLKALNQKTGQNAPNITKNDFNSGVTQFHVVPEEPTQLLGDYVVGYGHDDRACMFAALCAIDAVENPHYTSIALGVAREEIGSTSVGSANDVFLNNVIKVLCRMSGRDMNPEDIYNRSVMLSADVDIAFNPQNKHVNDKNNCSNFNGGAAIVVANGRDGNPTGNIVMPNDLYFIERFLDKKDLAYQVTALPS
ncbi:MAG: hypothetical protein ABIB71_00270, partial [Candidatus Woesearchaeota archaeon]